ncbi:hypothetical protein ON010_g17458 [Phytophthora cinnamomi]|nr:hypothetical protein ON010_g17458 [Phytophthora cinnamomi]
MFQVPCRRVRVVYVMVIWVGNIGASIDCLLGMDFMIAAGVQLWPRDGVVVLPDEEALYLVGGPKLDHVGLEVGVSLAETFLYGAGRRPKAVKVVNISDQVARITQHTGVDVWLRRAFTSGRSFSEPSLEYRRLDEMVARQAELVGFLAVENPTYQKPKKLPPREKPLDHSNVCTARSEPNAEVVFMVASSVEAGTLPVIAEEAEDSQSGVGGAEGVSVGEVPKPDMEVTGGEKRLSWLSRNWMRYFKINR